MNHFFASQEEFRIFISSLHSEKKLEGFKFLLRDDEGDLNKRAVINVRYFEGLGLAEGILFDVSDQYRQMQELQQANADLDKMVYHSSHDLRSPLTSILGLVNLGIMESSREVINAYFELIRGRIQHLDTLLKDLIYVSYNKGASVANDFFYFEEEARAIISQLESPNEVLKIILEVNQRTEFKTDPIRMRKILRNLLSNAFKYSSPVEPTPFVNLNIHVFTTHCKIYVKDNGIGIHPDFKDRVYDMFFRATEQSRGSGLGLYIVKTMVDKIEWSHFLMNQL
jgi:signal transduction histidine kinase